MNTLDDFGLDEPPIDALTGGPAFRWLQADGLVAFDIPELTRRVRNAWEVGTQVESDDPKVTEVLTRMLTAAEWESVCTILDLLPAVYAERDQARSIAMRLEEELHHLRLDDSEKLQ